MGESNRVRTPKLKSAFRRGRLPSNRSSDVVFGAESRLAASVCESSRAGLQRWAGHRRDVTQGGLSRTFHQRLEPDRRINVRAESVTSCLGAPGFPKIEPADNHSAW